MANEEHVAMLKQGVAAWNVWREEIKHRNIQPDLADADLRRADLGRANFREANLVEANLSEANLAEAKLIGARFTQANLVGAVLRATSAYGVRFTGANLAGADFLRARLNWADFKGANLRQANLNTADLDHANFVGADLREANLAGANFGEGADLTGADLRGADLRGAYFLRANLTKANLRGANLETATLVQTNLADSDLTDCRIFGVSAWELTLEGTKQQNLHIAQRERPEITVDNIEVAQFLYLLLNNKKLREVIDTITSKMVLILGRFTDERKAVLDALREELRKRDCLPMLFDFEKPRSRDTDETITLLARMARFVIADISDAKSVLQELRGIVPDLPSVPVQPIILAAQEESGMFDHYQHMPWFLSVHRYTDQEQLLADLGDKVIRPAELKVQELRG